MKIFCKFPTVNISKLNFWLVICIAKNLIWTTLKAIFSIFRYFLHPQIPDFQIVVSQPNIVLYVFSFQMMYKSQFQKLDPYDWFWGPRLHIVCLICYDNYYSLVELMHIWGKSNLVVSEYQFHIQILITKSLIKKFTDISFNPNTQHTTTNNSKY